MKAKDDGAIPMRLCSFVAISMLLAACATPAPLVVVSDAGPQPEQAAVAESVKQWLAERLKDPDSVKQFRVTRILMTAYPLGMKGVAQGWLACYEYNAKNSYGGYVGLQHDGLIVKVRFDGSVAVEMPQSLARPEPSC